MKVLALSGLLIAGTCLVSAQSSTTQISEQGRKAEIVNVYEAVVRYQISSWELSEKSYCIEINGRDASETFLKRLAPLPVTGRSGCREQIDKVLKLMSVVDKKTKKRAVIFDIESIEWHGDSEADLRGGYLCSTLCMANGVYHAVRDGSGWRVTRFDPEFVS